MGKAKSAGLMGGRSERSVRSGRRGRLALVFVQEEDAGNDMAYLVPESLTDAVATTTSTSTTAAATAADPLFELTEGGEGGRDPRTRELYDVLVDVHVHGYSREGVRRLEGWALPSTVRRFFRVLAYGA